jgi:predicted chitinase
MKRQLFSLVLFVSTVFFAGVVFAGGQALGVPGDRLMPDYRYPGTYSNHPSRIGDYGTRSRSRLDPGRRDRGLSLRQRGFPQDQDAQEFQVTRREECRQFLNETEALRKEFAEKRSAYFAAREDPQANAVDVGNQKKDIQGLFSNIENKNTQNCRWIH